MITSTKLKKLMWMMLKKVNVYYFIYLFILGSWRHIREDGINIIVKSIQKHGVLKNNFWFVMRLDKPEGNFKYIAIDCNHRLKAYQRLGIKKAMTLVFPPLDTDTYSLIAGIFSFFFFDIYLFRCC